MIEITHLQKSYPGGAALLDVNAVIRRGDVIAVIGPSGAGKPTLLRCINLLEKPDGGRITLDGEEILGAKKDVSLIRRRVGMIFQSFNLFGHMTAIENTMVPQMDLMKKSRQEAYDCGIAMLKKVGMRDMALKYPDEMSGGQKQRVAIARALCMDPEVILFDEPTSALDPTLVREVESVIEDLARAGKTMVIVTHEMRFARSVSSRVFYLDEGEIVEEGTPEEIFDHPQREKTRRFVKGLRVLEIVIGGASFDFHSAYGRIADHCLKNNISPRGAAHIQMVFEEMAQQILLPRIGEERVLFTLEYSPQEKCASLTFEYGGPALDPQETDNTLSLTLIRSIAGAIRHESAPDGPYVNRVLVSIPAV